MHAHTSTTYLQERLLYFLSKRTVCFFHNWFSYSIYIRVFTKEVINRLTIFFEKIDKWSNMNE